MIVRELAKPMSLLFAVALFAACGSEGTDSPGGSGGSAGGAGTGGVGGGGSGGDGGTGGAGGTGGTGGHVPSVVDVEGRVIDAERRPVAGARVALNGAYETSVTTGDDGSFSFSDVATPYDLAVEKGRLVYELRRLTRANPVIPAASDWVAKARANLSGEVTGATQPLPDGESVLLSLGPDTSAVETSGGAFEATVDWFGQAERQGALAAAHVRVKSDGGIECLAAGARADLTLRDREDVSDLSIDLAPVASPETQEATIQIDHGAYRTFASSRIAWFDLDGRRFRPRTTGWIPSNTTATFPKQAGIAVVATDAKERLAYRVVPVQSESVTTIVMPAEPALQAVEPLHEATGVSRTPTLKWTEVPGARSYWVTVGLLSFVLPATENSLEVGAYEAWNAGLFAGEGMGWEVKAFLDAGFSADDVADGSGRGIERRFLLDEVTMYGSGLTWFQTAP